MLCWDGYGGGFHSYLCNGLETELATYDLNGWPGVSGPPSVQLSPMSPIYRCPP